MLAIEEYKDLKESFEKACNKREDMLLHLLYKLGVDLLTRIEVKECKKENDLQVISFTSPSVKGEVKNYHNTHYYVYLSFSKEVRVTVRKALPVMAVISTTNIPYRMLLWRIREIMEEMAKAIGKGEELKEKAKDFMKRLGIETDIFDVDGVEISYGKYEWEHMIEANIFIGKDGNHIAKITVYIPKRAKRSTPNVFIKFFYDRYIESTFRIKPYSYVDIGLPHIYRGHP